MTKKYMTYPLFTVISLIASFGGIIYLLCSIYMLDNKSFYNLIMSISMICIGLFFFFFSLTFISFSKEKIIIYNYRLFGIPRKKEYDTREITKIELFAISNLMSIDRGKETIINLSCNEKFLLLILEYLPHRIKTNAKLPQRYDKILKQHLSESQYNRLQYK